MSEETKTILKVISDKITDMLVIEEPNGNSPFSTRAELAAYNKGLSDAFDFVMAMRIKEEEKEQVAKGTDRTTERISEELIRGGIENGIISFGQEEGQLTAKIGDNWFYIGNDNEEYGKTADDFPKEELIARVYENINSEPINSVDIEDATECLYYKAVLEENVMCKLDLMTAHESNNLEWFRTSINMNMNCARFIDNTINNNFEDNRCDMAKVLEEVTAAYGKERCMHVLAAQVENHSWDGRYSTETKKWAKSEMEGFSAEFIEDSRNYYLNAHAILINGLAERAIKTYGEQAKSNIERG